MRPTPLSSALWLALAAPGLGFAADDAGRVGKAAAPTTTPTLAVITVTATLTERARDEVPNTVDVIERAQLDQQLVHDLKDLVRYLPGVSVGSGSGRFGINDIRIRGLGGNRVRIETDGIAVADSFAIGSFANANRNFVDLDTLKRVEIVRGPASALHGSDALGGVVAFVSKDPDDYLGPGQRQYVDLKLGYESDWNGWFAGSTAAFAGERGSGLLTLNRREGRESGNDGDRAVLGALRTAANPQRREGRSLLGKWLLAPSAGQNFKLTLEDNRDDADTDVLSMLGYQPRTRATTLSLRGDDTQSRRRASLQHEFDALPGGFADRLSWQLYRQRSDTGQHTVEELRNAAGAAIRREREFSFEQRVLGLEATLHKDFSTGKLAHALTYGFELNRTELRQQRDGRAISLASGAVTPVVPPDVFPVHDFPRSQTRTAALFVQDEMGLLDGRLSLLPGLRLDRFELVPLADPVFAEDNPGVVPSGLKVRNVAPKLGAVWRFDGAWSLFSSYARGFRSPPYNDVNLGFTNLQHGYAAIPNPDLRPETSDGVELGLRYAGAAAQLGVTGFSNRYQDFIESGVVVSQPPQTPLRIFQSRNVAEAEIHGLEVQAMLDFGALSTAWQGWSLQAAAAWQRGDDRSANRPLAAVDPARATLGLSYQRARWGAELIGRFAERKRRLADPAAFAPPGHGVLDLMAHWQFAEAMTLNAGVFNLGDRRYWEWADVGGVAASSPVHDRYLRPGRHGALSVTLRW